MATIPDDVLRIHVESIVKLATEVGRDIERDEVFLRGVRDEAYARGVAEERHRQAVEREVTRADRAPNPIRGILGVFAEEVHGALATKQGRLALRVMLGLALGGWAGGGWFLGFEAAKESLLKGDPVVEVPDAR